MIDELDRPGQTLSRVLLTGTAIVMVLYLLLNFTFLYVAPIDALAGKLEIGYVAAQFVFGDTGAAIMGVALALLLVSTVSAMTLAGPRVLQVIGQDFSVLRFLSRTNSHHVPVVAVALQAALAVTLVLTATFESILIFAGFTLGASTFLTVAGLFVLRWRRPQLERPFRVPAYPLPPLIFLGLMGWTLTYLLVQRPMEGFAGIAILASGAVFYALSRRVSVHNGTGQAKP